MYMKYRLRRLLADFIDITVAALASAIFTVAPAMLATLLKLDKTAAILLFTAMTFIFFTLRDLFGRSVGKKTFGLKLIGWDGKNVPVLHRIRRNLSAVLFPVELLLILSGVDTLADTLGYTCVVDIGASGVPGMRRLNSAFRNITLALFCALVVGCFLFFAISSIRITSSAAYGLLENYMKSDEITALYGDAPLWNVKGLSDSGDRLDYTLSVNGKESVVSAVCIDEEWFIVGSESDRVEKLSELISRVYTADARYFALADINGDGGDELLVYYSADESRAARFDIYPLATGVLAGSFETAAYGSSSRGDWKLYADTDGSTHIIGMYVKSGAKFCESHVVMLDEDNGAYSAADIFTERTETTAVAGEDGERQTVNTASYLYRGRETAPSDYTASYISFFERYKPTAELFMYKWNDSAKTADEAQRAAVRLVCGNR